MGNPWVTSPPPVPIPVCLCVPQRCAGWGCTHRGIPHRGTHDERVCVGVCAGMQAWCKCVQHAGVCGVAMCACVVRACAHACVRVRAFGWVCEEGPDGLQ